MSKTFRLLASVAIPVVSLPLMMQPAAAMPQAAPVADAGRSDVIRVQQPLPPGAQQAPADQQEQRPQRRPPPEGQGGQGGQAGEGAQPQRRAQPAEQPQRPQAPAQAEQPQRPQAPAQAEQPPQPRRPAQAEQRPQPPAQADQAPAPAEQRPQRRQQQNGGSMGQAAPTDGAQPDQPRRPSPADQPQRNQAPAAAEQPPAKAPAEQPAQRRQQQNGGSMGQATPTDNPQRPQPPAQADQPAGNQPPKSQSQGAQPDKAQPNQPQPDKAQQPAAPAAPGAAPHRQANDGQPAPGAQPPAPGSHTPGAQPQAPGTQTQAPGTPPQAPGAQPPANAARPAIPGAQPPATAQQPQPQQPQSMQQAQPGVAQPPAGQPPAGQPTPGQPPVAATPQQVQRAKELAKDPSTAKSGEQMVLPVENGAAVLDSAKEQPMARPSAPGAAPGTAPGAVPGQPPRPAAGGQQPQSMQQAMPQQPPGPPPRTDAEAQSGRQITRQQRDQMRALNDEQGQRLDARPQYERPRGWDVRDLPAGQDAGRARDGARVIISIDNQSYVRHDDSRRFYDVQGGRQPEYVRLRDGQVREVIVRDDGTRIVTVRNSYGEIVQRSRIVRGGDEYVLYSAPELLGQRRDPNYVWRDPGDDLPPMRLNVPLDRYIIDTRSQPDADYYRFLEQPPVERVERVYTLDEVRYSARIRDKVPRIDLDTITFATGSAEIPMNQASSLRRVADAINKVLQKDPSETFLIEGHTDAVGSDESNLVLSDQRAESVARVLTDAFGIAPENLTTQGYGERYLKVRTDGPNQENRRVTIRRITPLVKPVASNR